ncbi:MAG: DUF3576 domain-containing protein [Deltaproteobacteria bacterium]|nr:DUF3576 domain-containing protein [Deltaproteobacteria bacterium]
MKKISLLIAAIGFVVSACSSGPPVKTQEYAKLSNTKDFEEEFPVVWKATINALSEFKVDEKDQEKGVIVTDWVYSTSTDKYIEYQVNGFPRKRYLQTRYKYKITLDRQIGKIHVTVLPEEEIENLKGDGSFDNWKVASEFDTGRANEMVRNIENKILSMPDALKPQN